MKNQDYLQIAINEAVTGINHGEQPYGAVLVDNDKVVCKAHSLVNSSKNIQNHAEIVLIDKYLKQTRRISDKLTLVTTCEPCSKCFASAIKLGVRKFIYGSEIETAIKYGSGDNPIKISSFKNRYKISIMNEVLKKQSDSLLENFYNNKILSKKTTFFSDGTSQEKYWMKKALEIGKKGMINNHELPIGVILVAGDEILSETSTLTFTMNSPITHGDFMALYKAKRKVYSKKCKRPLILYSSLEPHLLGIGAAIKCKVDKIVYGLEAIPDGGACYIPHIIGVKEHIPEVVGGVYRDQQYKLLKEFISTHNKNRVGYDYAKKLVYLYENN